jgi:hypothetical protein
MDITDIEIHTLNKTEMTLLTNLNIAVSGSYRHDLNHSTITLMTPPSSTLTCQGSKMQISFVM